METKEMQAQSVYKELIAVELSAEKIKGTDGEEFLQGIQERLEGKEEFKDAIYNDTYDDRLVITTGEGYVFVVKDEKVSFAGKESEIGPEIGEPLPDLIERSIEFDYSPKTWVKGGVEVRISAPKYPMYGIEYSFDQTTWRKFSKSFVVNDNALIYARLKYGDQVSHWTTTNVTNIDKAIPTIQGDLTVSNITTKGFKLAVSAKDALSGIGQITWYYKEENAGNWKVLTKVYPMESGFGQRGLVNETQEIKNLTTGTYKVYAEVYDMAGNIATTTEKTISLGLMAEIGVATYSPEYWTNGRVTVTLPKLDGYDTVYTINGTIPTASSMKYTGPFDVTENCIINYATSDGTNLANFKSKNVANIDTKAPEVVVGLAPTDLTTNKFTLNIQVQDTDRPVSNASGLSKIKWFYKDIDATNWTSLTETSYMTMNSRTSGTHAVTDAKRQVTGVSSGTYLAYAEIYDVAGNRTDSQTLTIGVGSIASVGSASYTPAYWQAGAVTVTLPTQAGFTTRYTTDGSVPTATTGTIYNGTFTVNNNCTINYLYSDGVNVNTYGTKNVSNIDKKQPNITTALAASNVTTNGFTLGIGIQDTDNPVSDASGLSKVRWFYKLSTAGSYTELSTTQYTTMNGTTAGTRNAESPTRVVTGLAKGTYNAYAIVYDVAGNSRQSSTINVTLGSITAVGEASYTPTYWTNGAVRVTLPTATGYTTRYTLDGSIPTATTGTVYSGTLSVDHNCTINYIYTDGINKNEYGSKNVWNIDTKLPDITIGLAASNKTTSSFRLGISVQDTDTNTANISGISNVQWFYKLSTAGAYTQLTTTEYKAQNSATASTTLTASPTRDVTGLASGSYKAYAVVYDVAGNSRTSSVIDISPNSIATPSDGSYSPTYWTNGSVRVTLPTATGYTTRYTTDGTVPTATTGITYTGPFDVTTNCLITYIYSDGINISGGTPGTKNVKNIDTKLPDITTGLASSNVTTSSFRLNIGVRDTDTDTTKAAGISKVRWFYKLSTASSYQELTTTNYTSINNETAGSTAIQTPTRDVTGLAKGTYNAYAIVYDVANNTRTSETISIVLGTVPVGGTASASPTTWTKNAVTVTLPTASGYTTRYTTNGSTPTISNSTAYSSAFPVSSNCTINYIYTDGTNINTYKSISVGNIDTSPVLISEAMTQSTITPTSIKVTSKVTDNQSGLKRIEWYKSTNKSSWTKEEDTYATAGTGLTGTQTVTHTFNGLSQNTKYYFYAKVYDMVENESLNKSTSVPLEVTTGKELVSTLSLNKSTAEVVLGSSTTIIATVGTSTAYNKNVNWTFDSGSSNLTLSATTTASGANLTITGSGAGTAVLRATAQDGSGKTATCTVTVKPYLYTFSYTGAKQEKTLPAGTYKFECWGAQGGGTTTYPGGKGGYATGEIVLTASTKLYIYVGGQGGNITGGFNGGANGGTGCTSECQAYGGGGGSDIRIATDSLYYRCIVAGGGGGTSASRSGRTNLYKGGAAGEVGGVPNNGEKGFHVASQPGTLASGRRWRIFNWFNEV